MADKGAAYAAEIARRRAGGKTARFITGDKELDAKLHALPKKLENKLVKKSLKKSTKLVVRASKRNVKDTSTDTGAWAQSLAVGKVFRDKRKKTLKCGVYVNKAKLLARQYKKKTGVKIKLKHLTGEIEGEFYPVFVELGHMTKSGKHVPGESPMRRALYDNAKAINAFFIGDLNELIKESAVKTA